MAECFCCEKQFDGDSTYCSAECETLFEAALEESKHSSLIKGLIDADGNSILGGAYQQAVDRTIREAVSRIGIKLPPKE